MKSPLRAPKALLKFIAKAAINHVTFGLGGDFVFDVVPDMARDVMTWARGEGWREPEWVEAIEGLGQAGQEELRAEILEVVAEVAIESASAGAAGISPQTCEQLSGYLMQVPAKIRATMRGPDNPTGRTVPPNLIPRRESDVAALFPERLPRFKPGDRAADWVLEEMIGAGGFGEVWRARHMFGSERAAVKFAIEPRAAATLRNEYKLLARVKTEGNHSGIVRLMETGLGAEVPFICYEYIEGGDLGGLIRDWHADAANPPTPERVARVVLRLAEIVAFAHALLPEPIVHRDLKPANILTRRNPDGTWDYKINDFGIGEVAAVQARDEARIGGLSGAGRPAAGLSAIRGAYTPVYASPQQMSGESAHPADDVYSLGVIWFHLLTGDCSALPGGDLREEMEERGVPEPMIALLAKCLARTRDRRIADAGAIVEALNAGLGAIERARVEEARRIAEQEQRAREAREAEARARREREEAARRAEMRRLAEQEQRARKEREAEEARIAAEQKAEKDRAEEIRRAEEQRKAEAALRRFEFRAAPIPPPLPAQAVARLTPPSAKGRRGKRGLAVFAILMICVAFFWMRDSDPSPRPRPPGPPRPPVSTPSPIPATPSPARPVVSPAALPGRSILPTPESIPITPDKSRNYTETIHGVAFEMIWIPPGSFMMGSPAGEEGRRDNEGPQHKVTLDGYWLGKHEITQELCQAVMGSNLSFFKGSGKLPVERVSCNDYVKFCGKIAAKTGKKYALPTEAQWEFACRAGTTTPFSTGATISTDQANYNGNHTYGNGKKGEYRGGTREVGMFPANAWGLHDMQGNVSEWCADWYGAYVAADQRNPTGPSTGEHRVLRGGSWSSAPGFCRPVSRYYNIPSFDISGIAGFRLARTP